MLALEIALAQALREVTECVGAGYVDLSTGALLGVKTVDFPSRDLLKLVASAAIDMFQGTNIAALERIFKKAQGMKDDGRHHLQEMTIFSDNLLHVLLRGKLHQDHVGVFIARKTPLIGRLLATARLAMPALEATLPAAPESGREDHGYGYALSRGDRVASAQPG